MPTPTSETFNALLYSGLIEQRGSDNNRFKGLLTGTNVNAFESFKGFINTDEGQLVIKAFMSGITGPSNQTINAFLLGDSSAIQNSRIRGLIGPFNSTNESFKGFLLGKQISAIIRAGINLGQKVSTDTFKGFMFAFDPAGIFKGLVFRPPAEEARFRAFLPPFDTKNFTIKALTIPNSPASEIINAFEQGILTKNETINALLNGITDLTNEQFKGFLEGVSGVPTEQINAFMSAVLGAENEQFKGFMGVLNTIDGKVKALIIGGPGPGLPQC